MTTSMHESVGAYALGLLTPEECDVFEAHLAECDACGAELEELMNVAVALPHVPADSIAAPVSPAVSTPPPPPAPTSVPARRSKRAYALAAGIALIAALGGVIVGQQLGDDGSTPTRQTTTDPLAIGTVSETRDPQTGVQVRLATSSKGWGTNVAMELSRVAGPLTCSLVAVKADGTTDVAASWKVSPDGYGTTKHPEPLVLSGGTSFSEEEIARWEVRTAAGRRLVSLAA